MSTGNGNTAAAIASAIDNLLQDEENLTTRSGLKLVLKVFSEGMVIVGKMDARVASMEQAYLRFTNLNDEARKIEEENQRELVSVKSQISNLEKDVLPTLKTLKWVGGVITAVIAALAISIATGKLVITTP